MTLPWLIAGHRVLRQLGSGAQGTTYLCESLEGKHLAIKFYCGRAVFKKSLGESPVRELILRNLFDEQGHNLRAAQELAKARALRHAHIVEVQELVEENAGNEIETYLVMEYVPGKCLTHIAPGELAGRTHELALQFLSAMAYVTQQGWVSHDLYSSNIMISEDYRLKIVDVDQFEELADEPDAMSPNQYARSLLFCTKWLLEKGNEASVALGDSLYAKAYPPFKACHKKMKLNKQSIPDILAFISHLKTLLCEKAPEVPMASIAGDRAALHYQRFLLRQQLRNS